MINEDEETTNDRREIPSLRRRVAQYDEYATHFTRLAEAEPRCQHPPSVGDRGP
jgi:hypothetical protein